MVETKSTSAVVIDTLNALLEAEENSIFRFMGEGSPYLSRATAEIRRPLNDMVIAGQQRVLDLADMIDRMGGIPKPGSIQSEEQYLAFLTIKFLMPKLIEAQKVAIERYENALTALKNGPAEVVELLKKHLSEHERNLKTLLHAAG
ncbi:MAG TPA: hypothetical protein VHD56_06210 [Tepidisphaeraceae bacterium]|nr:hypothetical protein [Tepidisphaeraceae bacterium]